AAERAAAVTSHSTVGIDDDLATGDPAIGRRSTFDELARRIHEYFDVWTKPVAEHLGCDAAGDVIANVVVRDVRRMLSRYENRLHARGLIVLVAHAHLRLHVRSQPGALALLAGVGEAMREAMRELNRQRHELRRFVARVAEHDALITGAAGVDTHRD